MTLYYIAEISIDPVHGRKLDHFKVICQYHEFKALDNALCAKRDSSLDQLAFKVEDLVKDLQSKDIYVWSYKIKDTLIDSNLKDTYKLLNDVKDRLFNYKLKESNGRL